MWNGLCGRCDAERITFSAAASTKASMLERPFGPADAFDAEAVNCIFLLSLEARAASKTVEIAKTSVIREIEHILKIAN
jgi:hypothetical protein